MDDRKLVEVLRNEFAPHKRPGRADKMNNNICFTDEDISVSDAIKSLQMAIDGHETRTAIYNLAIRALKEKQERKRPQALTLEELRKMDGQPVWVEPTQEWRIVCVYRENGAVRLYTVFNTISAENVLRNDGRIYRRQPEKGE